MSTPTGKGKRKSRKHRKRGGRVQPRRKLQLEALEQRLLLSADLGFAPELQQQEVLSTETAVIQMVLPSTELTIQADSTLFDPLAKVDTALAASFVEAGSDPEDPGDASPLGPIEIQAEILPAPLTGLSPSPTGIFDAPVSPALLGAEILHYTDSGNSSQLIIIDAQVPEFDSLLAELFQARADEEPTRDLETVLPAAAGGQPDQVAEPETASEERITYSAEYFIELAERSLVEQIEINRDAEIQVFVLSPDRDGLDQISEILDRQENVAAVHLLSHGTSGTLRLGSGQLNSQTLKQHAEKLKRWGQALTQDGDILLYGCDVASGEVGIRFVNNLAAATGADIAASVDDTGSTGLGGNWVLEYQHGVIEAAPLLGGNPSLQYAHLLANINGTAGDDDLLGNAGVNDTLTGNSGDDIYRFQDGWGADTVIEAADNGIDALDFSEVTADLSFTIHVGGTVSVTDGTNTVANVANVENLVGGSGTNTFKFDNGAAFAGTLQGGAGGINVLDYSAYTSGVQVNLGEGAATGTGGVGNINDIIGGAGNDTLVGDDMTNVIRGNGGLNTLRGGAGSDTYVITGSWQNDTLEEEEDEGWDTVDLSAIAANLTVTIDADADISVRDGSGHTATYTHLDHFIGGSGNDHYVLEDDWGSVKLTEKTGGGYDTVDFSAETNNLIITIHEEGDITAIEEDIEDGSSGLEVFPNVEAILAGAGDDTFYFDDQATLAGTIHGGDGNDKLDYSEYMTDVAVNLTTGTAHGTSSISNFEHVTGGMGDDTLIGNAADNVINGGFGDDFLQGRRGDDELKGGEGSDTVSYTALQKAANEIDQDIGVTVNLGTQDTQVVYTVETPDPDDSEATIIAEESDTIKEVEHVIGSNFDDVLIGSLEYNDIFGGEGDDTLDGRAGDDLIDGGAGSDTASYTLEGVGITANLATKSAQDGSGNTDTFVSIENLAGSEFDDALFGDDQVNILTGLRGNDTLQGGNGVDVYAFGDEWGDDIIDDAAPGSHDGLGNTLDFSKVTADLTFTLHADDTVSVKDGESELATLSFMPEDIADVPDGLSTLANVELLDHIKGGSGDDTFIVEEGASFTGTISGGEGRNTIDYSQYPDNVTVDFNTGGATGVEGFSDISIVGIGTGDFTITGSPEDSTASYAKSDGNVFMNLATSFFQKVSDGIDVLFGVDGLQGSDNNDTLIGNANNNTLDGGKGIELYHPYRWHDIGYGWRELRQPRQQH